MPVVVGDREPPYSLSGEIHSIALEQDFVGPVSVQALGTPTRQCKL